MHRKIIISLGVLFACANVLFLLYLLEPMSPTPDLAKELRILATDGRRIVRLGCCNDIKAALPGASVVTPSSLRREER